MPRHSHIKLWVPRQYPADNSNSCVAFYVNSSAGWSPEFQLYAPIENNMAVEPLAAENAIEVSTRISVPCREALTIADPRFRIGTFHTRPRWSGGDRDGHQTCMNSAEISFGVCPDPCSTCQCPLESWPPSEVSLPHTHVSISLSTSRSNRGTLARSYNKLPISLFFSVCIECRAIRGVMCTWGMPCHPRPKRYISVGCVVS